MILQRDFVDVFFTKFFGEEMGRGQGGPDTLVIFYVNVLEHSVVFRGFNSYARKHKRIYLLY